MAAPMKRSGSRPPSDTVMALEVVPAIVVNADVASFQSTMSRYESPLSAPARSFFSPTTRIRSGSV